MICLPAVAFILVYAWFTYYPIVQSSSVNASASNPLGFVISNFVFDGIVNFENILISCVFLFMLFLYYPRVLRISAALFMPVIGLSSGIVTELAALFTCQQSCSFYGMSGVSGGIVGYTFANFLVALAIVSMRRFNTFRDSTLRLRNQLEKNFVLLASFFGYIFSLLFLSGFFSIQAPQSSNQFPVSVQIPDTILKESQSVQVGHTTGIEFGLFLFALVFAWTNHRFHIFR